MAPKFLVKLDPECYIQCQVCVNQCGFDTHYYDVEAILRRRFMKLFPRWLRPYGRLYAC